MLTINDSQKHDRRNGWNVAEIWREPPIVIHTLFNLTAVPLWPFIDRLVPTLLWNHFHQQLSGDPLSLVELWLFV